MISARFYLRVAVYASCSAGSLIQEFATNVYLISQGQRRTSFLAPLHLGNHAAWAVYPLSLRTKFNGDRSLAVIASSCVGCIRFNLRNLARHAGLTAQQLVAHAAAV